MTSAGSLYSVLQEHEVKEDSDTPVFWLPLRFRA